jgi:phosphoheptose isomerase
LPDRDAFADAFAECISLHQAVAGAGREPLERAAAAIVGSLKRGGKVLVFGNGGSASDAQHVAAELVGRFERERRGLAAVALTSDPSVLTSVANDYGFEQVFARQIEALGRSGDVAIGITTSGRSANVLAGFEKARALGLMTIAVTGRDGGAAGQVADLHLNVPSASTPRIQEVHRTLLHVLCDLVETSCVA